MRNFNFECQTEECEYCHKTVAINSSNWHLQYCEHKDAGMHYIDDRDLLAPLEDAIREVKWAIEEYGLEYTLADLSKRLNMGSFGSQRVDHTINKTLDRSMDKMKLTDVLNLISNVNCPLCHKNPCECRHEEE